MKKAYKFFLWYFNSSGITNLYVHETTVNVSKFMMLLNFFALPFAFFSSLLIVPAYSSNSTASEATPKGATHFVHLVSLSYSVLSSLTIFFTVYYCIWNRNNMKKLIQNCIKIFYAFKLSSESSLFKAFEIQCFLNFGIFFFIMLSVKMYHFFIIYELEWRNIFIIVIFYWHESIVLIFMIFMSFFLFYFLLLIKHLNSQIEIMKSLRISQVFSFDALALKFLNLQKLIAQFHKVLGLHLSIIVAFSVMASTMKVCTTYDVAVELKTFYNTIIYFQFYFVFVSLRGVLQISFKVKVYVFLKVAPFGLALIILIVMPSQQIELRVSLL